ncbi:MAG: methionyl-tRNA formyltransferase [Ruminococcaceae bacterium]|nr:methionyl-tRNA formyltransferase [Oscillospiraceae bacterium]
MKIVFMGTPDFAVASLEKLIEVGHDVCAVFTQPDKPRGRKMVMTPPDVKVCALSHGLDVYQPKTLKDGKALETIKELSPDVIVVAAYGKILPKEIIDYPKYGCINIHGSILPKYRGAAPIQWSVINGDDETGVTTMQMNEGLDTGDILQIEKTPISIDDTASSVFDRLSRMGAQLVVKTLDAAQNGELKPIKQDDSKSSYAPMLDKNISEIDWSQDALTVHNKVRGLYSWPIAHTFYKGKKLKIYKTALSDLSGKVGEVLSVSPLTIACKDKSVEIVELQLEGKKRMDYKSFLLGHPLKCGNNILEA